MKALLQSYLRSYSGLSKPAWQRIAIFLFASFASSLTFYFSVYFVVYLHFSVTEASFVLSALGIGTMLGGIIGGKLTEHYSADLVACISLLLMSAGFSVLLMTSSVVLLSLAAFLIGAAFYGFKTANTLATLHYCGEESVRHQALNLLYMVSNLSIGVVMLLAAYLSRYSPEIMIYSSSIMCLLSAGYAWMLTKQVQPTAPITPTAASATPSPVLSRKKHWVLWAMLFCVFTVGLGFAQQRTTFPVYILARFPQMGQASFAILFMINCFIIVALQSWVNQWFQKTNKIILTGIGAFGCCFGFLMFSVSFYYWIAIVAVIVFTLGEMLFFQTAQLVAYQNGGAKKAGRSIGIYQTTYATSQMAGPLAGGFIYNTLGGDWVWYICGLIGLACLGVCWVGRKWQ